MLGSIPEPSGVPVVGGALRPAGSAARTIDGLWWLLLVAGLAVIAIVFVALLAALRRGGDDAVSADSSTDTSARWIVAGGVVLPTMVIAVVLGATLRSMNAVTADGQPDLVIEVTGHQWWWEVRYPDHGVVTANEVHVPTGADVELRLRSADVVHSFWVPELAGKMDLLPERVNTLRIDADEPGRYDGVCAEFCGVQHANMRIAVVAHGPADFDDWVAEQARPARPPTGDDARRGADVFVDRGCASCHTVRGTGARGDEGPDLTHVWSRQRLAAGAIATDIANVRDWIEDPHAIKEGVLMPAAQLSDQELDELVAYLEALR